MKPAKNESEQVRCRKSCLAFTFPDASQSRLILFFVVILIFDLKLNFLVYEVALSIVICGANWQHDERIQTLLYFPALSRESLSSWFAAAPGLLLKSRFLLPPEPPLLLVSARPLPDLPTWTYLSLFFRERLLQEEPDLGY